MTRLLLVLCSLPLLLCAADPVPVTLAREGQAAFPIVTATGADATIRQQAATLTEYLGRITGATFTQAEGDGSTGIAVGVVTDFPALNLAPRLPTTGLEGPETYLLRSHSQGLQLVGNSPLAVQHAVWDLLGRLGYRQYFPGEAWEIVPKVPQPTIALDEVQRPDWVVRRIWYGYGTWDYNGVPYRQWCDRNRATSAFQLNSGHAYDNIIHRNQAEFKAHPEYYGLRKGQRDSSKLCISNPGLRDLVLRHVDATFAKSPQANTISVDPSDGGGWCECAPCAEIGPPSNRALLLANTVAAHLEAKYPDKYVAMYAYNEHAPPPTINAHPRVIINAATAFLKGRSVDDVIAGWKAHGVQLFGIREYYSVNTWDRDLPGAARGGNLDYLQETLTSFHRQGARFMTSESSDNWGPNGFGYYYATRAMWNMADVNRRDELLAEFLRDCFGPAREPMGRFYRILHRGEPTILSRDLLGRLYGCLQQARVLAGDDAAIQRRLDHLLLYVRYVELYRLYDNAGKNDRQAAFEDLIRHTYRMRTTMMVHAKALYRDLVGRDKSVALPPEARWDRPEGAAPVREAQAAEEKELAGVLEDQPKAPTGNPLKDSSPWSRTELDALLAAGVAANPVNAFTPVAYSTDLRPAAAALKLPALPVLVDSQTDRGARVYYTWLEQAPVEFTFRVTGGLIAHYRDRGNVRLAAVPGVEGGEPVATAEAPPDGQTYPLTLKLPTPGLYRITASDGSDRTTVEFPPELPRVYELSLTRTSPHGGARFGYFYVPRGTTTIGLYSACSSGAIVAPDGKEALKFTGAADYFAIAVAPGQDGQLWQLRDASGQLRLLTVPPYLAANPAHLLLPQEVIAADQPK
jgi:hypothetical protein